MHAITRHHIAVVAWGVLPRKIIIYCEYSFSPAPVQPFFDLLRDFSEQNGTGTSARR
jgi:hypothetical protein